jgi:hypothetical protein
MNSAKLTTCDGFGIFWWSKEVDESLNEQCTKELVLIESTNPGAYTTTMSRHLTYP